MQDVDEAIDDVLIHYGKKGMKWGVITRKKDSGGGEGKGRKAKPPKKYSEEAARAKELRAKAKKEGAQSLSNKEMQELLTRMDLNSRYSKMNPSVQSRGQKIVSEIITNTGKEIAKEVIKAAVMAPLKKKLGTVPEKK